MKNEERRGMSGSPTGKITIDAAELADVLRAYDEFILRLVAGFRDLEWVDHEMPDGTPSFAPRVAGTDTTGFIRRETRAFDNAAHRATREQFLRDRIAALANGIAEAHRHGSTERRNVWSRKRLGD